MTTAPVVTLSGQSLHTLDDAALLQLLVGTDLPRFLLDLYAAEVNNPGGEP
jgi:Ser/Thr protein kinase RdoA (MazF antagonist)